MLKGIRKIDLNVCFWKFVDWFRFDGDTKSCFASRKLFGCENADGIDAIDEKSLHFAQQIDITK